MLYYDEFKEAIKRGFIKGDTVQMKRQQTFWKNYVNGNTKTARTFSLYHKSTRQGAIFFLPAEPVFFNVF